MSAGSCRQLVLYFQIARTLVKIRLQRIQLAQNDLAFDPDLQLGAATARHHDAFDCADVPKLTFFIYH